MYICSYDHDLVVFTVPDCEVATDSSDRKEESLPPDMACRVSTALVSLRTFRMPKLHPQRESVCVSCMDGLAQLLLLISLKVGSLVA